MTTNIPFKINQIGENGFHLMMKIIINGKSANVIIDTGASKTVFDRTLILKYIAKAKFNKHDGLSIGMGSNKIKSEYTTIKKIKFGTLEVLDYSAVLMDLSHVNMSYKELGLKQVVGVLGSDLLLIYKAVINYEKKSVTFKFPKVKKAIKK